MPQQQQRQITHIDRQDVIDALKHPATLAAAGCAALAALGIWYYKSSEKAWTGNAGSRKPSPTKGTPGQKIQVCGFWSPAGTLCSSASPYTGKVEAFLRFNGLPYERKPVVFGNTPKGRLPYLQHGDDAVADSRLILTYLENTYGSKLKTKKLSGADLALALAITHLVEDQYWVQQYHRMWTEKGKGWMHNELMKGMPKGIGKNVMISSLRAGRRKQMILQGVATNSEEEIARLSEEDVTALADLLDDKQFFFGDTPSIADAAVFGFLESHLYDGNDEGPLASQVRKHPNLVRFVDGIREKYFKKELAELDK